VAERLEPVILALGGGVARGLAHIGVLQGLAEDGAARRCGRHLDGLHRRRWYAGAPPGRSPTSSRTWTGRRSAASCCARWSASAFHELLRETLGGGTIEALSLPFAAVCCDFDTGEPVVLRDGSVADAVRASSAIPGILNPLRWGGRNLVDGAVVEPLPIAAGELEAVPGAGGQRAATAGVARHRTAAAAANPAQGRSLHRSRPRRPVAASPAPRRCGRRRRHAQPSRRR
jgi:predicted acylesterase/phospholipase RssA